MNTLGEAGLLMQIHERDRVKERRSETNWKSHYTLKQRSSDFLAPGTSSVEDSFSMDLGVGG